jgi:hypothetical protein
MAPQQQFPPINIPEGFTGELDLPNGWKAWVFNSEEEAQTKRTQLLTEPQADGRKFTDAEILFFKYLLMCVLIGKIMTTGAP